MRDEWSLVKKRTSFSAGSRLAQSMRFPALALARLGGVEPCDLGGGAGGPVLVLEGGAGGLEAKEAGLGAAGGGLEAEEELPGAGLVGLLNLARASLALN